jgi:beta-ureidopropionase
VGKIVRAALIQAHANLPKEEAVAKHAGMIGQAAAQGAQIVCLQEIFFGPYFCAQQSRSGLRPPSRMTGPLSRQCASWRAGTTSS